MFKKISLLALLVSGGSAYCAEAKMESDMDAILRMLGHMPEEASPHTRENANDRDAFGNTPLHNAVMNNELGEVILLLVLGAGVNTRNLNGHTPLMHGIVNNKKDLKLSIVNQILSHPNQSEKKDKKGATPAFYGHKEIKHSVTGFDGKIALDHAIEHLEPGHEITKRIMSGMSGH